MSGTLQHIFVAVVLAKLHRGSIIGQAPGHVQTHIILISQQPWELVQCSLPKGTNPDLGRLETLTKVT